ncbi:MAG: hypothetical protein IT204_05155 [Fimbriimonadaceae bacterium]|nr:hypothetical protein [Fimbriimonadaceae bacterium]
MISTAKLAVPGLRVALRLIAATVCLAALAQDSGAGEEVYLVIGGLRTDPTKGPTAVDPTSGRGATVRVRGPRGEQQLSTAPWERGGRTWFTATARIAFDTTYQITLRFADGTTVELPDYRCDREWTKVPIFTFNSTTGTKSPAAVLRSARLPDGRGLYVWALWPLENYRAVGGKGP